EFPLFPIPGGSTYSFNTLGGAKNQVMPAVDQAFVEVAGVQDYLLSRAAVAPMDVRIEAVMYAQHGSFFVIPGYPLNTDPSDTRDAALRRAQNAVPPYPAGTM